MVYKITYTSNFTNYNIKFIADFSVSRLLDCQAMHRFLQANFEIFENLFTTLRKV